MEGVEDIPGTALARGHPLGVGDVPRVPRRARPDAARARRRRPASRTARVRAYVMGERGADNEPPPPTTSRAMRRIVARRDRGRRARLLDQPRCRCAPRRRRPARCRAPSPTRTSSTPSARRRRGRRRAYSRSSPPTPWAPCPAGWRADVDWATRCRSRPAWPSRSASARSTPSPTSGATSSSWIHEARDAGANLSPRSPVARSACSSGSTTKHQFQGRPTYDEVAHLPVAERGAGPGRAGAAGRASSRRPGRRRDSPSTRSRSRRRRSRWATSRDYEPRPEASIAAVAARDRPRPSTRSTTTSARETTAGACVLFVLGGYADRNIDHIREMLAHPRPSSVSPTAAPMSR